MNLEQLEKPTTGSYATASLSSSLNGITDAYQNYFDSVGIKFNVRDYVAFHSDPFNNVDAGKRLVEYTNALDASSKEIVSGILNGPKLEKTDLMDIKYLMQDVVTKSIYFNEISDNRRKEIIDAYLNNNPAPKSIQSNAIPKSLKSGELNKNAKIKAQISEQNVKQNLPGIKQNITAAKDSLANEISKTKDANEKARLQDSLRAAEVAEKNLADVEAKIKNKQKLTEQDINNINSSLNEFNKKIKSTEFTRMVNTASDLVTSSLFDISDVKSKASENIQRSGSHAIIGGVQVEHAKKSMKDLTRFLQTLENLYGKDEYKGKGIVSKLRKEINDPNSILNKSILNFKPQNKSEYSRMYNAARDYIKNLVIERYLDENKYNNDDNLSNVGSGLVSAFAKNLAESERTLNRNIYKEISERIGTERGRDIIEELSREYRDVILPMADVKTAKAMTGWSLLKSIGYDSETGTRDQALSEFVEKQVESSISGDTQQVLEKDYIHRLDIKDPKLKEYADKVADAYAYLNYITSNELKRRHSQLYLEKSNILKNSAIAKTSIVATNFASGVGMVFGTIDQDDIIRLNQKLSYEGDEEIRLANSVVNALGSISGFAVIGSLTGAAAGVGASLLGSAGRAIAATRIGSSIITATRINKAAQYARYLGNGLKIGMDYLNRYRAFRVLGGIGKGLGKTVAPYLFETGMSAGQKMMALGLNTVMAGMEAKMEASGYFGGEGVQGMVEEEARRHRIVANNLNPENIQRFNLETYLSNKSIEEKVNRIRTEKAFWSNFSLLMLTNNMTFNGMLMNKFFYKGMKLKPGMDLSDPSAIRMFKLRQSKGAIGPKITMISKPLIYLKYYGKNGINYLLQNAVEAGQEVGQEIISNSSAILNVYPEIKQDMVKELYDENTKSAGTFWSVFTDAKSYNNVVRAHSEELEEVFVSTLIASFLFSGAMGASSVTKNYKELKKAIGKADRLTSVISDNDLGFMGVTNTGGVFIEDNRLSIDHSEMGKFKTLFQLLGENANDNTKPQGEKVMGIMSVLGKFSDFSNLAEIFGKYADESSKVVDDISSLDEMIKFIEYSRSGRELKDDEVKSIKTKMYERIYKSETENVENKEEYMLQDLKKGIKEEFQKTKNYMMEYENIRNKIKAYFENKHNKKVEDVRNEIQNAALDFIEKTSKKKVDSKMDARSTLHLTVESDNMHQRKIKEIRSIDEKLNGELSKLLSDEGISFTDDHIIVDEKELNIIRQIYKSLTGKDIKESENYVSIDDAVERNKDKYKTKQKINKYIVNGQVLFDNIEGLSENARSAINYLYALFGIEKLTPEDVISEFNYYKNNIVDFNEFKNKTDDLNEILDDFEKIDDITYLVATDVVKEEELDKFVNSLNNLKKLMGTNLSNVDFLKKLALENLERGEYENIIRKAQGVLSKTLQDILLKLEFASEDEKKELETMADEVLSTLDSLIRHMTESQNQIKEYKDFVASGKGEIYNEELKQATRKPIEYVTKVVDTINNASRKIEKLYSKIDAIIKEKEKSIDITDRDIVEFTRKRMSEFFGLFANIVTISDIANRDIVSIIPEAAMLVGNIRKSVLRLSHLMSGDTELTTIYEMLLDEDYDFEKIAGIKADSNRKMLYLLGIYDAIKWFVFEDNISMGELYYVYMLSKQLLEDAENTYIDKILKEFLNDLVALIEKTIPEIKEYTENEKDTIIEENQAKVLKIRFYILLGDYGGTINEIYYNATVNILEQTSDIAEEHARFTRYINKLVKEYEIKVQEGADILNRTSARYMNQSLFFNHREMYRMYLMLGKYIETKNMNIEERIKFILSKEQELYEYIMEGETTKQKVKRILEEAKTKKSKKKNIIQRAVDLFKSIFKKGHSTKAKKQEKGKPEEEKPEVSKTPSSTEEAVKTIPEYIRQVVQDIVESRNAYELKSTIIKTMKKKKISYDAMDKYHSWMFLLFSEVFNRLSVRLMTGSNSIQRIRNIRDFAKEMLTHLNTLKAETLKYEDLDVFINETLKLFDYNNSERWKGKVKSTYPFVGEGFEAMPSLVDIAKMIWDAIASYEIVYDKDKTEKGEDKKVTLGVFEYDPHSLNYNLNAAKNDLLYQLSKKVYVTPAGETTDVTEKQTKEKGDKTAKGGDTTQTKGPQPSPGTKKDFDTDRVKEHFISVMLPLLSYGDVSRESALNTSLSTLFDNIVKKEGVDYIQYLYINFIIALSKKENKDIEEKLRTDLNKIYVKMIMRQMVGVNLENVSDESLKNLYLDLLDASKNKNHKLSIMGLSLFYDETDGKIKEMTPENLKRVEDIKSIKELVTTINEKVKTIRHLKIKGKAVSFKNFGEVVQALEKYIEKETIDHNIGNVINLIQKAVDSNSLTNEEASVVEGLLNKVNHLVDAYNAVNNDALAIKSMLERKFNELKLEATVNKTYPKEEEYKGKVMVIKGKSSKLRIYVDNTKISINYLDVLFGNKSFIDKIDSLVKSGNEFEIILDDNVKYKVKQVKKEETKEKPKKEKKEKTAEEPKKKEIGKKQQDKKDKTPYEPVVEIEIKEEPKKPEEKETPSTTETILKDKSERRKERTKKKKDDAVKEPEAKTEDKTKEESKKEPTVEPKQKEVEEKPKQEPVQERKEDVKEKPKEEQTKEKPKQEPVQEKKEEPKEKPKEEVSKETEEVKKEEPTKEPIPETSATTDIIVDISMEQVEQTKVPSAKKKEDKPAPSLLKMGIFLEEPSNDENYLSEVKVIADFLMMNEDVLEYDLKKLLNSGMENILFENMQNISKIYLSQISNPVYKNSNMALKKLINLTRQMIVKLKNC